MTKQHESTCDRITQHSAKRVPAGSAAHHAFCGEAGVLWTTLFSLWRHLCGYGVVSRVKGHILHLESPVTAGMWWGRALWVGIGELEAKGKGHRLACCHRVPKAGTSPLPGTAQGVPTLMLLAQAGPCRQTQGLVRVV